MSIIENFNANDHSAEKRIIGVILLIALSVVTLFLFAELSKGIPDNISQFINKYSGGFFKFFSLLISILGISVAISFALDDEESEIQKLVEKGFIIAWILLFIGWSVYYTWVTYDFKTLSTSIIILILALVIVPGFVMFLISRNIRKKDIRTYEREVEFITQNPKYELTENDDLHWKYYPGYYGLICFPVYLVTLLIGYFIY